MRAVRGTALTTVLDMGFDAQRVDWALQSTDGSLTAALDHLEAHQDEPMPAQTDQSSEEASAKVRARITYAVDPMQCVPQTIPRYGSGNVPC